MEFDEVIRSLPMMRILRVLQEHNETAASTLKEALGLNRGRLVELTDRLEESGYISKSKRLIDRDLVTCFTMTSKGLKEFHEYQMKLKDHISSREFDYLPYHELLSSMMEEDTVVKHHFRN